MILVTGATGILGRVIVLDLLKRGRKVRATKRATSNLAEVLHSYHFYTENPEKYFEQIEWIDLDFEDLASVSQALEGISEVYHCAAKVSFHPDDYKEMLECNIQYTENLLYACENSGVQKFLFVSSIAVLDNVNEAGFLDEKSDFNAKDNHSDYALSKHFAEMSVWRASAEGLNTIIINPGVIIGSGNWKNSSGKIFQEFCNNWVSFSGNAAYVDVRDVAKISIELMENNAFGKRFIVISASKTYQEVANYLRKKVNRTEVKIVPKWMLNFGIFLNYSLGWLVRPLKLINPVNVASVSYNSKISNEKIKNELDYQFIPVSESLDFHFQNYLQDKDLFPTK